MLRNAIWNIVGPCFTANDIMQYLYYSNILSNIKVDLLVIPVIK